ncbi:MAG TPA: DUF3313 domain-containing protein [Bryobacteraceae bacterium]|nr:DUF3313 domain-containing protein [Bryobacteraceae bacterium]
MFTPGKQNRSVQLFQIAAVLGFVWSASCTRPTQTASSEVASSRTTTNDTDGQQIVIKKMPAGKEFSGFLKDYSKLKPNPNVGENALTFVRADEQKNLHKYIAMIVDPVQVYLASDADESKLPDKARGVAARYFHNALVGAVSSAFPAADQPGPLVLRLRSAIIGVDVDGEIPAADKSADSENALDRAVNIGKVGVEMELVDSETGEQIAAMVDRENLGDGAQIGAVNFSRQEKYAAAREAFDGWARRVREFLDSAQELSSDDAKRADQSYHPYGEPEK